MTALIPLKQKFIAVFRLAGVGVFAASAGIFFQTAVCAQQPAKVMGAVKSVQVADAPIPIPGGVQGAMKKDAAAVSGAIKTGGVVAATPISIPRPIKLQKITPAQLPAGVAQSVQAAKLSAAASQNDVIQSGEMTGIHDNEVTLRVNYQYDRTRPAPVYAGAFIYDAQGQLVNAGYKPATAGRPNGYIDITLVLPDQPFRSNHIVAFFMESGQPVFMNARFSFPYSWENGVLSEIKGKDVKLGQQQPAVVLQSNQDFCKEYAQAAVEQYRNAMANNMPGIVPPVWSDDSAQHYNWCLTASRDEVNNGHLLRQSYLDQHAPTAKPPLMPPAAKNVGSGPTGIVQKNVAVVGGMKALPNKQLDPGRGP